MNALCRSVPSRRAACLLLVLAAAHGCGRTHRASEDDQPAEADGGGGAAGRVAPTDPPPLFGDAPGMGGRKSPPAWPNVPEASLPPPEFTGCGTIACRNGAAFKVDFPLDFEVARAGKFTACRNDQCITGQLPPAVSFPQSGGTGFGVPYSRGDANTELVQFTFWGGTDRVSYIEVEWLPNSVADYNDGDLYTVRALLEGETYTLLEERVTYRDTGLDLPLGACGQHCVFAERDLRGSGFPTASDDAGMP